MLLEEEGEEEEATWRPFAALKDVAYSTKLWTVDLSSSRLGMLSLLLSDIVMLLLFSLSDDDDCNIDDCLLLDEEYDLLKML